MKILKISLSVVSILFAAFVFSTNSFAANDSTTDRTDPYRVYKYKVEIDGFVLGDLSAQENINGNTPSNLGETFVNSGPLGGVPDWNLLDQPGYSDYDCGSFFPTEWNWAFANNHIDVAQAAFIDTDQNIDGKTFYAGSHGHSITYIGACIAGGTYPNWDSNRVKLRIERKINGSWVHVNTYDLYGETNGEGEKFTFVATIPGWYRAVLQRQVTSPVYQRVGIGVAYKDFPLQFAK